MKIYLLRILVELFRMRKNENHFDAYDCWVNYAKKGASNELHNHAGNLSGVIYYTDCLGSPIFLKIIFLTQLKKVTYLYFLIHLNTV